MKKTNEKKVQKIVDKILSALNGLSVKQANDILWQAKKKLSEKTIINY